MRTRPGFMAKIILSNYIAGARIAFEQNLDYNYRIMDEGPGGSYQGVRSAKTDDPKQASRSTRDV
jgi:hypothetical protein